MKEFLIVAGVFIALFVIREVIARISYHRWLKRGAPVDHRGWPLDKYGDPV